MPDVQSLETEIYAILTAPAVDLNTVSAKRVRAQLKQNIPDLGDEWVREHKEQIDKLTAQVFDRVRNGATKPPSPAPPTPEPTPPAAAAPVSSPPPPAANTGKRKRSAEEEADAEYARRLASELNGHNTRAGSTGASRKKGTSKKKSKKSAAEIEDSDEEGEAESPKKKPSKPKKAKKKAVVDGEEGGEKKKGGYQKEYGLSPAMAEFTGVQSLSRPQIVKKLWDHIKANNLQNPEDKREILCDESMKQVFGIDRINMFKMNKLIGDHLFDKQE